MRWYEITILYHDIRYNYLFHNLDNFINPTENKLLDCLVITFTGWTGFTIGRALVIVN